MWLMAWWFAVLWPLLRVQVHRSVCAEPWRSHLPHHFGGGRSQISHERCHGSNRKWQPPRDLWAVVARPNTGRLGARGGRVFGQMLQGRLGRCVCSEVLVLGREGHTTVCLQFTHQAPVRSVAPESHWQGYCALHKVYGTRHHTPVLATTLAGGLVCF